MSPTFDSIDQNTLLKKLLSDNTINNSQQLLEKLQSILSDNNLSEAEASDQSQTDEIISPEVLSKILDHQHCDKTVLNYIINVCYKSITTEDLMFKILKKTYCDLSTLKELSLNQDITPNVILEILKNTYCNSSILERLSNHHHTNEKVMTEILKKTYCDPIILLALSRQEHTTPDIMFKILEKTYCDLSVLKKLSYHLNTTPKVMNEILEKKYCDLETLIALAEHKNTNSTIMMKILEKTYCDSSVLKKLSRHPKITKKVIFKIIEKECCDSSVLQELSQRPNLTPEIILNILKHPNFPITNPSLTKVILENIIKNLHKPDLWNMELIKQTESLHPRIKDVFLNELKKKLNKRYTAIKKELIKFHRIFKSSKPILGLDPQVFPDLSDLLLICKGDYPYISKITKNNIPIIFFRDRSKDDSGWHTTTLNELHIQARNLVVGESPDNSNPDNSNSIANPPIQDRISTQHNHSHNPKM